MGRKIINVAYCQYITVELSLMMVVIFSHSPPAMSTGLTLWNRPSVLCAPHCPNTIYLKEKESEPTKKNNYKWRVTLGWMEHMSAKALALVFRVSFISESWWKSSGPEQACLRASWSQEWSWQSNTVIPIEKPIQMIRHSNIKIRDREFLQWFSFCIHWKQCWF